MWVVKPAALNQGRGITVLRNLREILDYVYSQQGCFVVQKYIERPLLYKGRKFDIRVWVLVTASLQVYFYKEGYLRTSSGQFTLAAKEQHVHLTNQCLQNKHTDYGLYEDGNTLTFGQF